ncbi:MAG: ABC transporter permease, partial [Patescibacteria group bacterium]
MARHTTSQIAWALSDVAVLTKRNLIRYKRIPQLLFFSTVQPIMFLLLFTFVFGGAINVGGGSYINYLLPGILMQSALFGSLQTGVGLADDMNKGIIDRFRSLPMAHLA